MIIGTVTPGMTGKFAFVSDFSSLDGVYTLDRVMSFDDALSEKIDLSKVYLQVGKTKADYAADYPELSTAPVLLLHQVDDIETTLTIPAYLVDGQPNFNVAAYQDIILTVHVGVIDDQAKFEFLKNEVQQLVALVTGDLQDAELWSTGQAWLTPEEYQMVIDARNAKAKALETSRSKLEKLRVEFANMSQKAAALENIILQSQG